MTGADGRKNKKEQQKKQQKKKKIKKQIEIKLHRNNNTL
jgi:hypothetical protein